MSIENNPLRQYFRKPAIYIKLPSGGKGYKPGTINMPLNEELPIYPMTALDEITVKTPDALYNGTAVVDLIKSCVPNIKNPWELNSVDLDAIFIGIRTATDGNKTELETQCPKCEETTKYDLNLVASLNDLNLSGYDDELTLGELIIKFRPLQYKDLNQINIVQFDLQRLLVQLNDQLSMEEKSDKSKSVLLKITELSMFSLSKSIEYIKIGELTVDNSEYIIDFLKNSDKNTFEKIRDYSINLKKNSEMKPLKIKCTSCQHDYEQTFTLNMSDFFA